MKMKTSTLALVVAAACATPIAAMPVPATPTFEASTNAPAPVVHRRGFYVVRGAYYYNGHRGFVVARPGYRYHRGYWFPAAAFAAGAAAGAAIAAPPAPYRRLAAAHVAWCYDRYRSYRAYDNTYQPYNGPRQQCWSPYT